MKLYLLEFADPKTSELREPNLVGESGLEEFALSNFDNPAHLSVKGLLESKGFDITEITTTQDIFDMFDTLKNDYMNY